MLAQDEARARNLAAIHAQAAGMTGRRARSRMVAAIYTIALLLPATVQAAPDPAETAHDVGLTLGLQTQLPIDAPEKTERQAPLSDPWRLGLGGGDVATIVLYAALAIGLGLVLYSIRDRLPSFGTRRLVARRPDAVAAAAAVERMAETQIEADELAGQGKYAEAMHALLLRSLTEMRKRVQFSFADSLTSREILRALDLPEGGKTSLGDIIRRVEVVYFGLHPAGREDYTACRSSYETLTSAMQRASVA
jgi:hypothetical protein